jgi:DNA polymerase-3 subunit delta
VTPKDLERRLEEGQIDPLYLVTGEESWLVDEALASFRRRVVPEGDVLNTHLYAGADIEPASLAAMAETFPAFAPRRLIIVRDADRLPASDALTAYCANPSPTACLVLVMTKPDRRKTFVQAVIRRATAVACDPLTPERLREWMARRAATLGLTLTDEAVAYLQESSGGSLRALAHDLDKVALGRGLTDGPTGIAQLESVAPGVAATSVFAWAELVATGPIARALEETSRRLRDEAPLLLLSILSLQWRRMARCRALLDQRVPQGRMASALGIPPRAVDPLLKAVRHRTPAELIAGLTWCLETDAALKGSPLDGSVAMERLVLALGGGCNRAGTGDGPTQPPGRALTGAWWPGLRARGGR